MKQRWEEAQVGTMRTMILLHFPNTQLITDPDNVLAVLVLKLTKLFVGTRLPFKISKIYALLRNKPTVP